MSGKYSGKQFSNINIKLLISILLFIIITFFGMYIVIKMSNKVPEPFDYFQCKMKLTNVDHKFAEQYKYFNNKHVSCGPCKNATLLVDVQTCPTDPETGITKQFCNQLVDLESSLGNPVEFPSNLSVENVKLFFCIP
jgi:hypothetical protein